jgi:hypothetical protein
MPKAPLDITDQKFGRFTALYLAFKRPNRESVWFCRCDCGNERFVGFTQLRQGKSQSCGCLQRELVAEAMRQHHARKKAGGEAETATKAATVRPKRAPAGRPKWAGGAADATTWKGSDNE